MAARLTAEGDIRKAESAFREAALAFGNEAFLAFLSGLPENAPACHVCGGVMTSQGKRKKRIVSMLGEGMVSRTYYECEECGAHSLPKDEALGIAGTQFTPGVRRAIAKLAASDSFEGSSLTMLELSGVEVSAKDAERIAESIGKTIREKCAARIDDAFSEHENVAPATGESVPVMYIEYDGTGIPVKKSETEGRAGKQEGGTAKTREMKLGCVFTQHGLDEDGRPIRDKGSTSYFAAIEQADDFGRRVYTEALRRGADAAGRLVIIGDGAKWIWNIADLHFPGATQIVDLYHAKEHIWEFLGTLVADETKREKLKDQMCTLLDAGDITALTAMMRSLPVKDKDQEDTIESEAAYFTNNAKRMNYADFKRQRLFVGSGVIEAGCKNVIGKRLKQSGMHWSVRGANSIAALRCRILSGEFDDECLLAA